MRDGDIDVYDRRNQSFFHLSSIPGFPEKHMITEAYEIGEDKSGDIWIENAQYVLHIQNEWSGHKSWLEEDIAITFFNTKVDTLSSRPNL